MENPWEKLIEEINESDNGNYVLKQEQAIVEKYNKKVNNDLFKIHTQIMPAPFMGDVHNAPIVILMLNPGYDPMEDEIKEDGRNFYNRYKHYWKNEIQHIQTIPESPFFALDIEYCKSSPYWGNKLKFLLEHTDRVTLAKKICTIQLFPYHSKNYKPIYKNLFKYESFDNYLPSQKYNFDLVDKAMARNAIIIIARGKTVWFKAVDGLEHYENKHSTRSAQNITISKNNLPDVFDQILAKLK